jgi:hypothetical protein
MPTGSCISAEKWVFSPSDIEGNVGDHPGDKEVHDEEDGDVPGDVGDQGDGTDGIMFEAVS